MIKLCQEYIDSRLETEKMFSKCGASYGNIVPALEKAGLIDDFYILDKRQNEILAELKIDDYYGETYNETNAVFRDIVLPLLNQLR